MSHSNRNLECLNKLSALIAVQHLYVVLLSVLTTHYRISYEYLTVQHHICSTRTLFEPPTQSFTYVYMCINVCIHCMEVYVRIYYICMNECMPINTCISYIYAIMQLFVCTNVTIYIANMYIYAYV